MIYQASTTAVFLKTATEIGQRLAHEAVWQKNRCNWIGPFATISADRRIDRTYHPFGSDLYSGTGGVALFLAELAVLTGDPVIRRTAMGAINQAISCADTRRGFYSGGIGTAFAVAHVGTLLQNEVLMRHASRLLHAIIQKKLDEHEFDIISGNAGAIAALLVLQDILDDGSLLDFAVQLGDELLQRADVSAMGYSWSSPGIPARHNLTGFSHGVAGVGYALFELFQVTGAEKYRHAAEQACAYERYWFDAKARNWPDFRDIFNQLEPGSAFPCATLWCHGAAGIALSRLRAYELFKDEQCKSEAIIGLQTTQKMVEQRVGSNTEDYSLCHGLAGNVEVLLYGSQVLGNEWIDSTALALAIAQEGIERYAQRDAPWPCGMPGGGETFDLMLGLAGIGHFYLRLYDPTIPSVLLLRKGTWGGASPSMRPPCADTPLLAGEHARNTV